MRVELEFESPLIVGNKRLTTNYIESKDYISGSVIRAAIARNILNHCEAYHGEVEEIPNPQNPNIKEKKKNWIHYRGKEACKTCEYAFICKKFGESIDKLGVKFSFFYPEGTSVIPLTSMICKNNPKEHGFIDSLTKPATCSKCAAKNSENARVEFTSGLRNKNGEFKAKKLTQTKTAINPYTRTAQDGQLYSLTSVVQDKFVGEIEGFTEAEMIEFERLFKTLRIGAYTSTGYGKCKLAISKEESKQMTLRQVKQFSAEYKAYQKEVDKEFIVLLLTADAEIEMEVPSGYVTTEKYQQLWQEHLKLPIGKVHKIYLDTTMYRGYDTSVASTNYRAAMKYHILKGSVIVLEVEDIEEAYELYKLGYSIGNQILNGYGQCEIYCGEADSDGTK